MTVQPNQKRAEAMLKRWAEKTASGEAERPHMPLEDLTKEALAVARVIEDCWEPETVDGRAIPGLVSVAASGTISRRTAEDIRELQLALSEAQAHYDKLVQYLSSAPVDRGDEMLDEMRAALSFLLEDGNHERGAAQLAQLRDRHPEPASQKAMAMALEAFAELAQEYLEELRPFQIFPVEIIDEALVVARDLRVRAAERESGELFERQRQSITLRNRIVTALTERVSAARRAIRYVFKDEPAILKRAASAYQRKYRARARSQAVEKKGQKSSPAKSPTKDAVSGHESTLEMPVPMPAPAAQT